MAHIHRRGFLLALGALTGASLAPLGCGVDAGAAPTDVRVVDAWLPVIEADRSWAIVPHTRQVAELTRSGVAAWSVGDNDALRAPTDAARVGDRIWVTDRAQGRVVAVDDAGALAEVQGAETLQSPWGIVQLGDRVYVADPVAGRVHILDLDGRLVGHFGDPGGDAIGLRGPRGIATDGQYLYVAEGGRARVLVVDADGRQVATIGGGDDGLHVPRSVALDARGHLYVADAVGRQAAEYDRDGRLVRRWTPTLPGFTWVNVYGVSADPQGRIHLYAEGAA